MSNRIVKTTAGPGWTPSIDRPSVRRLHEQYAATCGHVDRGQMRLYFSKVGRLRHTFGDPLCDGYLHYIGANFSAGVGASVAIAFPHFCDESGTDGTTTDRLVSVHTMGNVAAEMLDEILDRLTEAIGADFPLKPPESDLVATEVWSGSSDRAGII